MRIQLFQRAESTYLVKKGNQSDFESAKKVNDGKYHHSSVECTLKIEENVTKTQK